MAANEDDLSKSLGKLWSVAIRRRWWILLPACSVALGTILVSRLLPNRYRSEATILVEPQKVPERYVVANTTLDIRDALQAMTQTILSRTRLLRAIEDFGLYPTERDRLVPEQLVELMRRNIEIEPIGKDAQGRLVNAFRISFTGQDPKVAQQVTSRLTSMFIEENLKSREEQAAGTTRFLQDQLETAHTQLEERGQHLRDFKMRFLGELPEEQQGNLGILTGLQTQLQNTEGGLNRAREQRSYLESLVAQYRRMAAAGSPLPLPGAPGASPVEAARLELARLRAERAELVSRYTPRHPDVRKIDQQIAESEASLERLTKAAKASEPDKGQEAVPAGGFSGDTSLAQVNSQLEANRLEIADLSADQKRLQAQIAEYQRRLNLTPVREQQLTDLVSSYELAKQNYADLLSKKTQSELATNLEMQQKGQQFRIVDQPSLPAKPSSPDRVKISLGGAVAGLLLGAGLAFLREAGDHSLCDEQDASRRFGIPLVVSVPLLLSPAQERWRPWKLRLEWLAGSFLVMVVAFAEYYVYRRG